MFKSIVGKMLAQVENDLAAVAASLTLDLTVQLIKESLQKILLLQSSTEKRLDN